MSAVLIGWLRSRRFPVAGALWASVAVVGAAGAQATVQIPLLKNPVQLPVVLLLVVVAIVGVPLPDRFGLLERSFARAVVDRAAAAVVTCALSVAALLPAVTLAPTRFPWTMLLALMALAVLGVCLLGSLGWLPALVAALVSVYVELNYRQAVTGVLDLLGVPVLLGLLAAPVLLFVLRGPRPVADL
ncbi:MAG: hypothetical protein ACTHOD_13955 [Motilibacteraceae bacterium]